MICCVAIQVPAHSHQALNQEPRKNRKDGDRTQGDGWTYTGQKEGMDGLMNN